MGRCDDVAQSHTGTDQFPGSCDVVVQYCTGIGRFPGRCNNARRCRTMICRKGRIFGDLLTLPVDNKRIIWDDVTILHNDIQVFTDFLVVVTLSDDTVLVLVNFREGVTTPDDAIRVNPDRKVEKCG